MEQIKIIFAVVATGFINDFIKCCYNLSKSEIERIMKRINIIGSTVYKISSAMCVIMSGISILFGISGCITYSETKNSVASFLVLGLILLIFSYSFVPPKKFLFIKIS